MTTRRLGNPIMCSSEPTGDRREDMIRCLISNATKSGYPDPVLVWGDEARAIFGIPDDSEYVKQGVYFVGWYVDVQEH